jgi:hypothetical protein
MGDVPLVETFRWNVSWAKGMRGDGNRQKIWLVALVQTAIGQITLETIQRQAAKQPCLFKLNAGYFN